MRLGESRDITNTVLRSQPVHQPMIFSNVLSRPTRFIPESSASSSASTRELGRVDASLLQDSANETGVGPSGDRALYETLLHGNAGDQLTPLVRTAASDRIHALLQETAKLPCELPESVEQLSAWMTDSVEATGHRYQAYLARRKAGGSREYFSTRSHALAFLRAVAPTKLVDGAWLYGLMGNWRNPRFNDLIHTYVEELGDGSPDKNHVLLYRQLLQSHGIDDWEAQPDSSYTQGALQLALAACTEEFLPEVIGFNLGYEQLPLHLLITAYELNELGIDPYYFTLHVTVDNAASGHARRAVQSIAEALPQLEGGEAFWQRIRNGFKLNDTGIGTNAAIAAFDLDAEFHRVLGQKSAEGRVAHSDYCRIEGRTVNEWLADPQGIAGFVGALERKGWLRRGGDPAESRFWQMLRGERAEMFGVFSEYELQVIYDWLRGDASADGARVPPDDATAPRAPRSFRHQRRAQAGLATAGSNQGAMDLAALDPDAATLEQRLASGSDQQETEKLLLKLMGPAHHWSVAGLHATRIFANRMLNHRVA
ncbi:Iron-containing redox enzyme [Burkholderiales bacterium 8X]|nr:Iron-containing redox enzyme [Burkholderiales bacterium 8X]